MKIWLCITTQIKRQCLVQIIHLLASIRIIRSLYYKAVSQSLGLYSEIVIDTRSVVLRKANGGRNFLFIAWFILFYEFLTYNRIQYLTSYSFA